MGPSQGLAQARPGPVHFSRDWARNFEKGLSSTQARDRFLEKGLENWDFYVVKKEARQGSGSNFCEGPGLGLGSRSIFKARDRPGIDFLGLDPSLGATAKDESVHKTRVYHYYPYYLSDLLLLKCDKLPLLSSPFVISQNGCSLEAEN